MSFNKKDIGARRIHAALFSNLENAEILNMYEIIRYDDFDEIIDYKRIVYSKLTLKVGLFPIQYYNVI